MSSKFKCFLDNLKRGIDKHSPEILIGLGVSGMITSTVLAVKATPKALVLIDQAENEKERDLTKIEVIKETWKEYIPSAVIGAMSIGCIIGGTRKSIRRTAAIATAYKISETTLKEWKEKTIEVVGDDKVKEIKEKINENRMRKNPEGSSSIIISNGGEQLCYDSISGRYFKSDMNSIEKAINKINKELVHSFYISLSELYDELGLEKTNISDELGWNLDDGLVEVSFDTRISDDGRPCIVLDYMVAPRYDFSKFA